MADLIDRDAIFPLMERKMDMQDLYLPVHFMDFVINEIPSVNRWIPVEDDLPKNRVTVIFTINRGTPKIGCGYRIHSERGGLLLTRWFDKLSGLNFSDYDVKAWMPMPNAYESPESEVQEDD